ncbi:N-acetyltransferase [Olleya aquimaris]|nr:N-acetyltransferase [Olleya aquimaris]
MDAAELVDNEFLRQFELKIDDHFAKIEYSLQERKIFLTKLILPEPLNNEEFISEFLKTVLDTMEDRNLSVVPTSPEIAKFIRRNRRYKKLLPVGLRI